MSHLCCDVVKYMNNACDNACDGHVKVILKKDDRITLYCKGADSTIYPRLNPKCAELQQITTRHLSVCHFSLILS